MGEHRPKLSLKATARIPQTKQVARDRQQNGARTEAQRAFDEAWYSDMPNRPAPAEEDWDGYSDLSAQSALDEKFLVREYLASSDHDGYTENEKEGFWDAVFGNSIDLYSRNREVQNTAERARAAEEMAQDLSTQSALDERFGWFIIAVTIA